MREQNIAQWSRELENFPRDILRVLRPTPQDNHIPRGAPASSISTKVKGPISQKKVYNLQTLASYFCLADLEELTTAYVINNIYQDNPHATPDASRLADTSLGAYNTLQIPVLTFDDNGHIWHKCRCTGPEPFRQKDPRHDWVFVWRQPSSRDKTPGSLDGRVPAQLNSVFQLTDSVNNTSYYLAHISLLKVVGSQIPDGPEGMPRVGIPMRNYVIPIADIEGIAHLIPIETDRLYLVNNRIDQHTWNDIHDGN